MKKILIVEDNDINLRLIRTILKARGYLFVEARDGEEAQKIVVAERPDIILMDIQIPKVDGLEVTRRIRAMDDFKDRPIIAITAHAMEGDRKKILEAGCDGYIVKPINTRTFIDEIEAIIKQKTEG
ncbi:MAG: two-component response regulator [Deltaproteobacteria bacterium]|nr:two-component response regulator [Deltaproteobacteria bacterium]MBM2837878.1 two-component response regulator [Deltaproteobacteria bacterium]